MWGNFTKNGTDLRPGQFFFGFDPFSWLCWKYSICAKPKTRQRYTFKSLNIGNILYAPNPRQDNVTFSNLQILEIFYSRQTQDKTTQHFQIFKPWKSSFCQRCPQLGRDVRNTGENRCRQIFAKFWYKCWKYKGDYDIWKKLKYSPDFPVTDVSTTFAPVAMWNVLRQRQSSAISV